MTARPRSSLPHPAPLRGLFTLALAVLLPAFPGPPAAAERVGVALFPFIAVTGPPTSLERTIYDHVAARVEEVTTARQVDREALARFAAESDVDLHRPFPAETAAAIAARAGAEIVVLGRTRRIGDELVVVARIFGVGGSGSEEVLVSGSSVGRIAPLLSELAEGIAGTLGKDGKRFSGGGTGSPDLMSAFAEGIAGLDRPTVFLQVRESYDGDKRTDSVTEAELLKYFEAAGLVRTFEKSVADVVVFAHAVGSQGTGSGVLMNSDVKVEFRAVAPSRGELLAVAATAHRAADIFASLSGTRAFSEATASVAPEFIHTMVRAWDSPGQPPR